MRHSQMVGDQQRCADKDKKHIYKDHDKDKDRKTKTKTKTTVPYEKEQATL